MTKSPPVGFLLMTIGVGLFDGPAVIVAFGGLGGLYVAAGPSRSVIVVTAGGRSSKPVAGTSTMGEQPRQGAVWVKSGSEISW